MRAPPERLKRRRLRSDSTGGGGALKASYAFRAIVGG